MSNIDKIRLEIIKMRELAAITAVGNHTDWLESRIATCGDILSFIDSLPEEKPSEDLEEAADKFEQEYFTDATIGEAFIAGAEWQKKQDEDWLNEELIKAHLNGVMTGDRIAREENQTSMPEDTVIFQKGVAEGRRLEREDRNDDKLPRNYGD